MTYRAGETEAVVQAWLAGQCVSVVGVGSAGKSNFVQHLAASGSRTMPAANWPGDLVPIVVDSNLLGPLPPPGDKDRETTAFWAGCELLLHRTFMALYPFDGFAETERNTLYQAYEALQDGTNPLFAQLALRYLELGLSVPLRAGLKLAFILDEFERLATLLPTSYFQSLRGLRDVYKRRLTLTAVSRTALSNVMQVAGHDALQAEPFAELFHDCTVYLGAFATDDAQAMIQDLLGRRRAIMSVAVVAALLAATGGYPGLLRACVLAAIDQPALGRLPARDLVPALLTIPAVMQECQAIWLSLSASEQITLRELVTGRRPADSSAAAILQLKGLVTRKFQLQPPVMARFIALVP
jgi:hypothetical protein